MFRATRWRATRWANAFLAASGKDTDEAILCLKALVEPIKSAQGVFLGNDASVKLEKYLRESAEAAYNGGFSSGLEYAIRFICLLVEKRCFQHIDSLINLIEKTIDKKNGILYVTVQAAVEPYSEFKKELAKLIKEKTGAAGVKLETEIKPELLGGYLLRIGEFYIDASLKGQLEKMTADLISVGGNNGELQ